jgi:hypothetical protein
MCPHCGQNAPLVYKGVSAFCSACGKPRTPFTANAVNLRGKPAKIGGTVAAVAGWVVLGLSLTIALVIGVLLQAIFPAAAAGWVIGGVIATFGLAASLLLLFGGRALRRSGTQAAEAAKLEALGSLAAYHNGVITPQGAADALGLPIEQADQLLTSLAKQPESGISLEFDEEGRIAYRFARYAPAQAWPRAMATPAPPGAEIPGGAVGPRVDQGGRVRVNTEVAQPMAQAPPAHTPGSRGGTTAMPKAQPVGPEGTMVIPERPPVGARIPEPDEVLAEATEDPPDPRRARS